MRAALISFSHIDFNSLTRIWCMLYVVCLYLCMYVYICMYVCMYLCTYVCLNLRIDNRYQQGKISTILLCPIDDIIWFHHILSYLIISCLNWLAWYRWRMEQSNQWCRHCWASFVQVAFPSSISLPTLLPSLSPFFSPSLSPSLLPSHPPSLSPSRPPFLHSLPSFLFFPSFPLLFPYFHALLMSIHSFILTSYHFLNLPALLITAFHLWPFTIWIKGTMY